jgi:hypothetical protein
MGDLADIAREIIDATSIVTDAANASPGKPVNISVIPGLSPQVPTNFNLTGTLGGTVGGALSGVLNALVNSVKITVKYKVAGGPPGTNFVATPPLSADPAISDPLNVAFLLKPPIAEDTTLGDTITYTITVDLTVNVEGHIIRTGPPTPPNPPSLEIPVVMPALGIPALLLLNKHADFKPYDGDAGQLVVMVKAASPLRELGSALGTINKLMSTVKTLQSVLGWGTSFADFTGALTLAVTAINTVPTVFFSLGNARDLGDFGGFDDEASSLLLIGIAGTQVTLFSQEDFNQDTGTLANDEHTVFTADDVGAALGITTGVGIKKVPNFSGLKYDTDNDDDLNDSIESARFGGVF